MRFIFRFQQLLDIALFEENEVKNRLAAKNAQIAEIENKIAELTKNYDDAIYERAQEINSGNFENFHLYGPYLNVISRSKVYYENELEVQERQREKIMSEFLEKQRSRKTYETLKERDMATHKKEMLKKEQKVLDEFGKKSLLTLEEE
jgi:flagellar export protein FliJ